MPLKKVANTECYLESIQMLKKAKLEEVSTFTIFKKIGVHLITNVL